MLDFHLAYLKVALRVVMMVVNLDVKLDFPKAENLDVLKVVRLVEKKV
jgi:hypothetical protein